MSEVRTIAVAAKQASYACAALGQKQKNDILTQMADALEKAAGYIIEKNALDRKAGQENGMSSALLDRLLLDEKRIGAMAQGLRDIAALNDPIGETMGMWKRPNGLEIGKVRVPLGVVGIIYEARPNVTADAVGLCLKTSNAVVLRGGSDAIHSNTAICDVLVEAGAAAGLPSGAVQLVKDTSRQAAQEMMGLNGLIDVLIPRGGAGLIQSVVKHATVPVIETGTGNCHIYVDETADLEMAGDIVINAKTTRPGVCNAAESLLVHQAAAEAFLPDCLAELVKMGVEIRGCEKTRALFAGAKAASEEDYATEFLDLILSVKVVADVGEAIGHINRYGSNHSEAIVTKDYENSRLFLSRVDAAAVYVNASTRFTDGFEFGYGAEIGISTQKLHARGPMGLNELTTTKYIVYGSGQIR
ncbi:MAG: glutamate-5-semialdehyde dehydrogenase [Christensenellales bacterium]|jgi:glutamate-5-semialdehyde dehydrogenase